jgi:predicted nucleotidyltransferase
MMITNNNLLLYGSLARGESRESSDVDLLSVTSGKSKKIVNGRVNLSLYNSIKIQEMAENGSLFVYHLVSEGIILNDENDILLDTVYNVFKKKESYEEDLLFSKYLLSLIEAKYSALKSFCYANIKVSWCVRTFIAALGANNSTPLFSVQRISNEFGEYIAGLLEIKNSEINSIGLIHEIQLFMEQCFGKTIDFQYNDGFVVYKNQVLNRLESDINAIQALYC